MLNLIQIDNPIKVNGVVYPNSEAAYEALKDFDGEIVIQLNFKDKTTAEHEKPKSTPVQPDGKELYRIRVRQYMTKPAEPGFDFMEKFNNNVPMPLRVMYGEILEETRGMYKMRLHGRAERNAVRCSHCWRELTHPISRIYGIGPICGEHYWNATPATEREARQEEEIFREMDKKLRELKWEGWVIKSAIEEMVRVAK